MAIIKRTEKGSALTHQELDNNFTELENSSKTVSESHSEVLTFNKNKYTDTAISQSGTISYTLSGSGNVDGVVIRHKILSDGTNPITFSSDFNVFNKSEDDVYPSGLHIFYFNFIGGEVDTVIPTYTPESTTPTEPDPTYSVAITSPTEGQEFNEGDEITITAEVTQS